MHEAKPNREQLATHPRAFKVHLSRVTPAVNLQIHPQRLLGACRQGRKEPVHCALRRIQGKIKTGRGGTQSQGTGKQEEQAASGELGAQLFVQGPGLVGDHQAQVGLGQLTAGGQRAR